MGIDLSKFKSLKVYKGASEIRTALEERYKRAVGGSAKMGCLPCNVESKDGTERLGVRKHGSLASSGTYTMPEEKSIKDMVAKLDIPWQDAYASRVQPWWCSDQRVDRHGDIVDQSWDFKDFKNNPLMLFSHNWDQMPIGNMVHWEVAQRSATPQDSYAGPSLLMLGLFATKDQSEFADSVYRLVKAGFLRTVSVGFYPGEVVDVTDNEERAALGLGPWGYVLRNNELIELSPTSVPANPGAYQILNRAKAAGILQPSDITVIRELKRGEILSSGSSGSSGSEGSESEEGTWKELDKQLRACWKSLYPEVKIPGHQKINETVLLEEIETAARSVVQVDGVKALEKIADETTAKALELVSDQLTRLTDTISGLSDKVSEVREGLDLLQADQVKNLQSRKGGGPNRDDNRVGAIASLLSPKGE